jgi:hypothetical protein
MQIIKEKPVDNEITNTKKNNQNLKYQTRKLRGSPVQCITNALGRMENKRRDTMPVGG